MSGGNIPRGNSGYLSANGSAAGDRRDSYSIGRPGENDGNLHEEMDSLTYGRSKTSGSKRGGGKKSTKSAHTHATPNN